MLRLRMGSGPHRPKAVEGRREQASRISVGPSAGRRLIDLDAQLFGPALCKLPKAHVAGGTLHRRASDGAFDD